MKFGVTVFYLKILTVVRKTACSFKGWTGMENANENIEYLVAAKREAVVYLNAIERGIDI